MKRRDQRWQLRGVLLFLAALFAVFAVLGLAGLDWAWRACATAVGMALGYGCAYLAASWVGAGWVLRALFGLMAVAVFGVGTLFFVGTGTIWGGFLYGLGFALLLAVFGGLASR